MEKGFILALVFAIIIGIFALANGDKVAIDFVFTQLVVSQAMVIIISTFLGAITVFIISFIKRFKLKQNIKDLNRKIDQLEKENNLMRNLDQEEDKLEELE